MTAALIFACLAFFAGFLYFVRKSGREASGFDNEKDKNAMAQKALRIRDRLLSDDGFAARVRKRFTR